MSSKKGFSEWHQKKENVSSYGKKESGLEKDRAEIAKLQALCAEIIDTSKIKHFLDVPLSKRTYLGLKKSGYKFPTDIQREVLPLALKGLDILGAAKTGSGKTLAFLIPILELLYKNEWTNLDGLGALVITPVRELAYQIFEVLKKIGKLHELSAGLLIGGSNLQFERSRLKNCNIIIASPGRLLQHMDENPLFDSTNLKILVLDEADKILDLGFASTLNAILENLPQQRQTLLFSATQTRSLKDLVRLSLKDPMLVSVNEHAAQCTPETLEESYIVCELHEKLNVLWSFIRKHSTQKIIVFMMSCKQVKYTKEVFVKMRPGIHIMALYGTLHQHRRLAIYDNFCKADSAVLLATDIAARGLDFPAVDWVIQLDCPEDVTTYIHRAGRTARCEAKGESVLVLLPSEEETMISELKKMKIPITKISINPSQQSSIQGKLEAFLARDVKLKESAQRAFVNYIRSTFLMKNKKVFDVRKLDTDAYARSLGLVVTPRLRFLQRASKITEQQKHNKTRGGTFEMLDNDKSINNSNVDGPKHTVTSSEDEDDQVLTFKRKIMPSDDNIEDERTESETEVKVSSSKRHEKHLSKAFVAKKILNKQIQPNTKLYFSEDGEIIKDPSKERLSDPAEDDEGGINIETAMAVLRKEDEIDKKLYQQRIKAIRQEKRLKEESRKKKTVQNKINEDDDLPSDESSSVDLSFLPDPDKVYGKVSEDSKFDSETNDGNSCSGESDIGKTLPTKVSKKRKFKVEKTQIIKRRRADKSPTEDANIMDTGLSLRDDEELALRLLSSR